MVGDSRRSRKLLNWRNIKSQYKYKRLIEEEEEPLNDDKEEKVKYKESLKQSDVKSGKGLLWSSCVKMSKSVQNNINFLRTVAKKTPKKRQAILREFSSDKGLFNALSELSHNLIKGNIPINDKQRKNSGNISI